MKDFDNSEYAFNQQIQLAQTTNNHDLEAQATSNLGVLSVNKGNHQLAIGYFECELSLLLRVPISHTIHSIFSDTRYTNVLVIYILMLYAHIYSIL